MDFGCVVVAVDSKVDYSAPEIENINLSFPKVSQSFRIRISFGNYLWVVIITIGSTTITTILAHPR
jgi:hypothetical protein